MNVGWPFRNRKERNTHVAGGDDQVNDVVTAQTVELTGEGRLHTDEE